MEGFVKARERFMQCMDVYVGLYRRGVFEYDPVETQVPNCNWPSISKDWRLQDEGGGMVCDLE